MGLPFLFQPGAHLLYLLPPGRQLYRPLGHLLQRGQLLLHLLQLTFQLRDLAHAAVHPAAIAHFPQPLLRLGVGHILPPGGHQVGDPFFQLRGRRNGQGPPLADEGRALVYLTSHPGKHLAAVGGGQLRHGLPRVGIDGRKAPKGGIPPGAPAQGDLPALPLQLDLPLHGGARPGLVAVLVRQIVLLVPVPGVDSIEHGLQKGAPGGLARLVGGGDQVQPLPQLQPGLIQSAKAGGHGFYFHKISSQPSRAAMPKRTA